MRRKLLIPFLAAILVCGPAYAHYPFAATYVQAETIRIEGKLASFVLRNPQSFLLQAAPGAYHLFAWHEMMGAPYLNAEFMSKIVEKGIAMRITPNGRVTMDVTAN